VVTGQAPVQRLKIFLLIAAISSAVYANSFSNSFHFDDQHYITANPYIRDLSNIPSFFKSTRYSSFELTFTGHYRPLLVASYALNYAIGGLNPAGYHAVNLLFHVGSAFLVFLILEAMLGSSGDTILNSKELSMVSPERPEEVRSKKLEVRSKIAFSNFLPLTSYFYIALASALIFAVHPFNAEVVNYITARSSVMCSFFYLLAFYCWVKFRSQKSEVRNKKLEVRSQKLEDRCKMVFSNFLPLTSYFYLFSLLAFALAMLTKEIAITLPVMLFLYDFLFPGTPYLNRLKHYLPFLLLVAVPYLTYRILFQGGIVNSGNRDFYSNLLTQPEVLLKYIQLMIVPAGLTIEHHIARSATVYSIAVMAPLSAIILIMTAVYLLFRKGGEWRILSFFILWFFITLLPTTLIPLNAILQENRGYLSGIGVPLFAGILIGRLPRRISTPFLLVVVSFCSIVTIQRNHIWKDEYTLWKDAVDKAPYSARAHDNLGLAYINRREYEKAIAEFNKTIELQPRYYLAYYNAGVVYQLLNRLDLARSSYETCLKINPQSFRAYYNLGILYKKEGELDKAVSAYENAISLDPRHPFVYNNLGVVFMEKGEGDRAEQAFKRAAEIDPGYVRAYFNLGNLYYRTGRYNLAVEAYRTVLKLQPDNREAERMLNAALGSGSGL